MSPSEHKYPSLDLDMARHISTQFRQEYIQAGRDYSSSMETSAITDNTNNNKRKDLSSSDSDIPLAKIMKSMRRLFIEIAYLPIS